MENDPVGENLVIKPETLKYLNTTRKWTMFLSIIGFIGLGTFIISGLIAGVFLSVFSTAQAGIPEWIIISAIPVVGLIAFFPLRYLFRFSKFMGRAVKNHDQSATDKAFRNLRSYYVYIGIVLILTLAIYLIVFIVAGASVALFNIK